MLRLITINIDWTALGVCVTAALGVVGIITWWIGFVGKALYDKTLITRLEAEVKNLKEDMEEIKKDIREIRYRH